MPFEVTPPDETTSNVQVVVTGQASSTADAPRTVYAQLGRPSFSQYILLTNDEVWIGGPLTRQWFGKTHSNTGICIDTANINDTVSCANATYSSGMFGGNRNGVWSGHIYTVPSGDASRKFWTFPVPAIDFNTVTSDFAKLSSLAVGTGVNIPYATATAHDSRQGWYIKLLPNKKYQIRRVTGETESPSYSSGNDIGGTLTISTSNGYGIGDGAYDYPTNGVIYVNDNVWVEGTNINGRITIASSGTVERERQERVHVHPRRRRPGLQVQGWNRGCRPHSAAEHRDTALRALAEGRPSTEPGHGDRRGDDRADRQGVVQCGRCQRKPIRAHP